MRTFRLFIKSFGFAFKGISVAVLEQRSLKIQLSLTVIMIFFGFYFNISAFEWALVIMAMGTIFALEMLNSAVEALVDLVTLERKPQAGKIKDIAAGAVVVSSIAGSIVGLLVFGRYFFN